MANARFKAGLNVGLGTNGAGPTNVLQRGPGSGANFHPSAVSLIVLVLAEYAIYIGLRRYFRHAHGG